MEMIMFITLENTNSTVGDTYLGKMKREPRFKRATAEDEAAFDVVAARQLPHPSGCIASVAHITKGALGAGILGVHVAYMKGGVLIAIITNVLMGIYVSFCLYTLGRNAQILCKRTLNPYLTFADVGEAAFTIHPSPRVNKFAKIFRYLCDLMICLELFGACCCYQLIVAKTIKQLVEDKQVALPESQIEGYPHLRVYLAVLIIPFILLCLLRHLQWLAPFSIVANCVIAFAIVIMIYYAIQNNPTFEHMIMVKSFTGWFEFAGMTMFSMSCVGVVLPVENNLKDPKLFTRVFFIGMTLIILATILAGLFGYAAYLEECQNPMTMNFPMRILPKILKVCIAIMVYVTHALNFWPPFQLMFFYIAKNIKNENNMVKWEFFFRALICLEISLFAIAFPKINALIGFLGCFCLTNAAFIFPHIESILLMHETGYGKLKWRLIVAWISIIVGLVLFVCGSYVNGRSLFVPASSSGPKNATNYYY